MPDDNTNVNAAILERLEKVVEISTGKLCKDGANFCFLKLKEQT